MRRPVVLLLGGLARFAAAAVPAAVALVAACAGLWAASGVAHAHIERAPTLVNRYVTLSVLDDHLDVRVSFLFGELPAGERRRAMDTDGDGHISPQERTRERLAWHSRAGELVRLWVNGRPVNLDLTVELDLDGDLGVGAAPLEISAGGTVSLPAGPIRLRVEPGREPPRLGDTEVTIDVLPSGRLLASAQGRAPETSPPEVHFRLEGPRASALQDRSVTFVLAAATGGHQNGAGEASTPLLAAAAGVLALAVVGGLLLAVRRRRARVTPG